MIVNLLTVNPEQTPTVYDIVRFEWLNYDN